MAANIFIKNVKVHSEVLIPNPYMQYSNRRVGIEIESLLNAEDDASINEAIAALQAQADARLMDHIQMVIEEWERIYKP